MAYTLEQLQQVRQQYEMTDDPKALQALKLIDAEIQKLSQQTVQDVDWQQKIREVEGEAQDPISAYGESAQHAVENLIFGLYNLAPDLLKPEAVQQFMAGKQQESQLGQAVRAARFPVAAPLGKFTGEVAAGGGAAKLGTKALPAVAKALPASRIPGAMVTGTVEGGMIGMGEQPVQMPYMERVTAAAPSAAYGAFGGMAAVPATYVAGKLAGGAAELAGKTRDRLQALAEMAPEQQTGRVIKRFQERGGFDPEQVLAKREAMGPEAALADVPEMQMLGQATAVQTPAGRAFEEVFEQRQMEQQGRIMDEIARITGVEPGMFREGLETMISRRKEKAAPLYEEAYQVPLMPSADPISLAPKPIDRKLMGFIDRLGKAGALSDAKKMAEIQGKSFNQSRMTFEDIDVAKRALDDKIQVAIRAGEKNKVRNLVGLKNEMLEYLDTLNPAYKAAREIYAGESSLINATELGRDMFRPKDDAGRLMDRDQLIQAVENMSDPERQAFQLGGVKAINEKLAKVPDTADNARRLWSSPDVRERLNLMFPDADEFDQFLQFLDKESAFTNTLRDLYQGSQTAQRLAAQEALGKTEAKGIKSEVEDRISQIFSEKLTPESEQMLARVMFDKNTTTAEIRKILEDAELIPRGTWGDKTIQSIKDRWRPIWRKVRKLRDAMPDTPRTVAIAGGAAAQEAMIEPTAQQREADIAARQYLMGAQR